MPGVVEGPRAVHGGAVVPDDEVAEAPRVAVHELRLGRVLDQVPQEEPALGHRPVDDPRRVRGDVERPAAGARDGADERMDGALQVLRLVRGELEPQGLARVRDRVVGAEPSIRVCVSAGSAS